MSKDKIKAYEECKAMNDYSKMIEAIEKGDYHEKQSRLGSLLEAHISAIIGAPFQITANIVLLILWMPDNPTNDFLAWFALATWPVYLYISIGRQYAFRRVFEKYGIEPKKITQRIRNWWSFDD